MGCSALGEWEERQRVFMVGGTIEARTNRGVNAVAVGEKSNTCAVNRFNSNLKSPS